MQTILQASKASETERNRVSPFNFLVSPLFSFVQHFARMFSAIRQSALRSRVALPRASARAVRHSSSNAAMPKKTDLPWIIVSALVFIVRNTFPRIFPARRSAERRRLTEIRDTLQPTIFYMTAPPSDAHAHAHAAHAAHSEAHHDEPEAAEAASEEVEEIAPVEEEAPAVVEAEPEAPVPTQEAAPVEKEDAAPVDDDSVSFP